jgi:hypothetical protein
MSDDDTTTGEQEPEMTSLTRLPWNEAWLLVGRLESEGMQAKVFPDHQDAVFGGAMPVAGLDTNFYEVLVETARLEDARAIAKDIVQE